MSKKTMLVAAISAAAIVVVALLGHARIAVASSDFTESVACGFAKPTSIAPLAMPRSTKRCWPIGSACRLPGA